MTVLAGLGFQLWVRRKHVFADGLRPGLWRVLFGVRECCFAAKDKRESGGRKVGGEVIEDVVIVLWAPLTRFQIRLAHVALSSGCARNQL